MDVDSYRDDPVAYIRRTTFISSSLDIEVRRRLDAGERSDDIIEWLEKMELTWVMAEGFEDWLQERIEAILHREITLNELNLINIITPSLYMRRSKMPEFLAEIIKKAISFSPIKGCLSPEGRRNKMIEGFIRTYIVEARRQIIIENIHEKQIRSQSPSGAKPLQRYNIQENMKWLTQQIGDKLQSSQVLHMSRHSAVQFVRRSADSVKLSP